MSVEFNDENNAARLLAQMQSSNNEEQSTLTRWIMSSGIAKTTDQANKVLIGIAIVAFLATGIIIYKMNGGGGHTNVNPEQIREMERNLPGMPH